MWESKFKRFLFKKILDASHRKEVIHKKWKLTHTYSYNHYMSNIFKVAATHFFHENRCVFIDIFQNRICNYDYFSVNYIFFTFELLIFLRPNKS